LEIAFGCIDAALINGRSIMGGGWLGGGWQGGGWQGGGWQGGGWQGGGWQGGGWQGGGAGGPFAMRVDQPRVAKGSVTNTNAAFPVRYWDADLYALTFLPEFFKAKVGGKAWDVFITVGNPPIVHPAGYTGVVTPGADSIDDLRNLAVTERPEAMGEILDQHQNQQVCFMDLLMMTQNSHPKTFFVMKVAARVGEVVMMHLKRQFNRPRPSQMFPLLSPSVGVPGHSAYPAGHALIARLTANVLTEVTTKGTPPSSPYAEALRTLATEIGFNRVIAGFHFRSDITAGETAGDLTHQFLQGMPPIYTTANPARPHDFDYKTAIAAAQAEW
jgi:hypothetical protein